MTCLEVFKYILWSNHQLVKHQTSLLYCGCMVRSLQINFFDHLCQNFIILLFHKFIKIVYLLPHASLVSLSLLAQAVALVSVTRYSVIQNKLSKILIVISGANHRCLHCLHMVIYLVRNIPFCRPQSFRLIFPLLVSNQWRGEGELKVMVVRTPLFFCILTLNDNNNTFPGLFLLIWRAQVAQRRMAGLC